MARASQRGLRAIEPDDRDVVSADAGYRRQRRMGASPRARGG